MIGLALGANIVGMCCVALTMMHFQSKIFSCTYFFAVIIFLFC
ncbi:hypothetical protein LOK49_LG07G01229 [Camellia lanceoleosa]|uniref:Uncharacterized protein n=1 Tax=Camellia lanceoleosa TaxID=1840588 RepID=A0ACC0H015_9ERIC|nr:hypothetical protein LOK49_LG07G01229 [Camellia lanceoleosa]